MSPTHDARRRPRRAVAARRLARRRVVRQRVGLATLALAGVLLMLYPPAATWVSSLSEAGALTSYSERVAGLTDADRDRALAAADAYNDTLTDGPIVDPFSNTPGVEQLAVDADARAYLDQLALDDVMARIRVPAIGVDLPVFHGTTDETLRRGIGHLYGTSLPVGGSGTHAVLTGHSGLPEAELFTRLADLEEGDEIVVETMGESLTYRVTGSETVEPTDIDSLRPAAGRDQLTLLTCTPIGINTHRLLVHAERVDDAPAANAEPAGVGTPWALIAAGVAVAGWGAVVVGAVRRRG
nr:class C sortase [Microbacterium excoecariae]